MSTLFQVLPTQEPDEPFNATYHHIFYTIRRFVHFIFGTVADEFEKVIFKMIGTFCSVPERQKPTCFRGI